MKDDNVLFLSFVVFVIISMLLSWRIDYNGNRIKALEAQLEKKEAPKPDYEKYRDCCAYYPD